MDSINGQLGERFAVYHILFFAQCDVELAKVLRPQLRELVVTLSKAKLNSLMETDPVVGVKLLRKFIESLSDKIARTNDVLRHTSDYDANTVILPSG